MDVPVSPGLRLCTVAAAIVTYGNTLRHRNGTVTTTYRVIYYRTWRCGPVLVTHGSSSSSSVDGVGPEQAQPGYRSGIPSQVRIELSSETGANLQVPRR